jgi:HlyD family secretion protein
LLAEKLISQEVYDDAKTTFDLARNARERSLTQKALIEERLTKSEVRAPFDCTVLIRPVSVGQAVSGSGGFNSGTEVLTIADLNSLVINAHVNQADVPSLKVGQTVEVGIEAVTGLTVTGLVERIAPQATIRNNIKGFAARILLENVDRRVRPGMTANVKIPVGAAEDVMAVPLVAVFTDIDPESGVPERYVYVKEGNRFSRRTVEVGLSDFFYAEIRSGLNGDEVVALEQPKDAEAKKPEGFTQTRRLIEPLGPAVRMAKAPGLSPSVT